MKDLPLVISFMLAAVILPIGVIALVSQCGCGGATPTVAAPTPFVEQCAGAYALCVPSSSTIEEYKACRDNVDRTCLPDAGTRPTTSSP